MKKMPEVELIEVDKLGNNDRGGLDQQARNKTKKDCLTAVFFLWKQQLHPFVSGILELGNHTSRSNLTSK